MRPIEARLLEPSDLDAVQQHLARDARANLLLIDLVARLGQPPAPGEMRSQVAIAEQEGEIRGVVALRPTVVFDAGTDLEALDALVPFFEPLGVDWQESAAADVERYRRRLDTACREPLEQSAGEVEARRRRGDGARAPGEDGLVVAAIRRQALARVRELRDPARLSRVAAERGFQRPKRIVDLPSPPLDEATRP